MAFALSTIELRSTAFEPGGRIPKKHSSEGENLSPPLSWTRVPEGTRSFAVICHDPDAPVVADGLYGFVHWVLYNIPASVTSLREGTLDHTNGQSGFKGGTSVAHCRLRDMACTTISSGCSHSVQSRNSKQG